MHDFLSIRISEHQAKEIASELYGLEGEVSILPGELDFNFRIKTNQETYILKVSRPNVDGAFISYQNELLNHLTESKRIRSPEVIPNKDGNQISTFSDENGNPRKLRLLTWIDGRLWSSVNPINDKLLFSLGQQAGKLTNDLKGFDHPLAHRSFDWDISQASWIFDSLDIFSGKQKTTIAYFHEKYRMVKDQLQGLRKAVVHNDANDNNVIVSHDLINPEVEAIIDFGDAIYTNIINDLAVTIAYAVMGKNDFLEAACQIVKGYHQQFPLEEEELELLYTLFAMRLVISVTKSAINKKKEPKNEYLLISEKPAWDVLLKLKEVNPEFAHYCFREACGYTAHPAFNKFNKWVDKQQISLTQLFPTIEKIKCYRLDLGMESTLLGHFSNFNDLTAFEFNIARLQQRHPDSILAGGYLETRPIYTTGEYKKEGDNGPEYRTVHLGIDFWLPAHTPVHALFDGKVCLAVNDKGYKEYGGLVILQHETEEIKFYTLYGHQSVAGIEKLKRGDIIKKGDRISELGSHDENGNWGTHLHFQILLDVMGNEKEFPGVCYPSQKNIWAKICPDPNLLFKDQSLQYIDTESSSSIIKYRERHLGRSLSLSYNNPLHIVRGEGAFLIDESGRKYLDTINNVAHVGHEHPRVVEAAKNQIGLLNTNTRYLHKNIAAFAEELLATFPEEFSVVHFVNSGSEANELALRMAKSFTGQKDMIAIEVGYHGNTNACVDVSSYKFDGKGGKGAPEYTHIVPLPDSFRGIYRGDDTGSKYAGHISDQINTIQNKGRNLAGFICESIISCGGQIELPENYLKFAVESVKNAGGLYIADEVQVGCGRVGSHFWGFQIHDVMPDIVTIGKPIGNGHPLAAVVCTQEVAGAFANGMEYFNTFGGNPVSCVIGLEVLKVIKDERLQENALTVGNYLKADLCELQEEFDIIGDVRGKGLFLGFELTDSNRNPLTAKASYLANRMKELGILMSADGKDVNVLKIKPPMVFSKENADELINRLRQVFSEDFMIH